MFGWRKKKCKPPADVVVALAADLIEKQAQALEDRARKLRRLESLEQASLVGVY